MSGNTKNVKNDRERRGVLDVVDRKLLRRLTSNADASLAELGALVHLSPPAVHERIRKLKQCGMIRATVAQLDGPKIGRHLLAFVHLETSNWETTRRVLDMASFPEVEEIHTVAGDTAMILKVRTAHAAGLEDFLGQLHRIEGFRGVKTYIALGTYIERGPQPLDG